MRWRIIGADSQTGRDVAITFDAPDQGAAERLASYNGILVASIHPEGSAPIQAPTLNYRPRPVQPPPPSIPQQHVRSADNAGYAVTKQYKVLTQKDKWFSQKFDPAAVEAAINAYAQQGWKVKVADTASFPGFFSGNREELIAVLERGGVQAMYEYKVLTQKDKWFSGKFDPDRLEAAINAYA